MMVACKGHATSAALNPTHNTTPVQTSVVMTKLRANQS